MKRKSAFSVDKPEDSLGYMLWKTTTIWQRQIKAVLSPFEISHAQFVIIAVVRWLSEAKKDPSQNDIKNLSGLDKMTISKSLKKLSSMGLVARVENSLDARAKIVSLTRKGHDLIEKVVPLVEAADRQFFAILKRSDQSSLMELFRGLLS